MSHTLYPMRRARLQRSELAVPGSNLTFIDRARHAGLPRRVPGLP
ncbi:MAG: hypothetical protein ACR2FQ_06590 [Pseudonocardiaceae bacterium]